MPNHDLSSVRAKRSDPAHPWDDRVVRALIEALTSLRQELTALQSQLREGLDGVHPDHSAGAVNLVHYVGLRRHDLRQIQEQLAWIGLSSLGRSESHVLANLDKVLGLLHILAGEQWRSRAPEEPAGFKSAELRLIGHANALFGPPPASGRDTRIMVTLGTEASRDYGLVRAMVSAGMNCARINCAHDDPDVWAAMIANVVRARRDLGRACPVLMDLAGPKLRTGQIQPGPLVLKMRPQRDVFGRVFAPARIFVSAVPGTARPQGADAMLQVDSRWLDALSNGELIEFIDARGARRGLKSCEPADGGRWMEATQTAYVTPDTVLRRTRSSAHGAPNETRARFVPDSSRTLVLRPGDTLVLRRDQAPGRAELTDAQGRIVCPASIPCTLPQVFEQVQSGERISLDDGKIRGVIRHVSGDKIHVEITAARVTGSKLGADKGINLPDSTLDLPALTEKDLQDLSFVASHANMVGMSFIQQVSDIEQLQQELERRGRAETGIVLKIETRRAFENLPDLMLAAMRSPKVGVMIARGDLAVELGYERMAEVQEEIMWLAEAAHLPVIWATQVLETLAKHGQPSRAEITDAAMSEQAECVMLNKGPHVLEAIEALDDILSRMRAHHHKKRAMMRQLHWWST